MWCFVIPGMWYVPRTNARLPICGLGRPRFWCSILCGSTGSTGRVSPRRCLHTTQRQSGRCPKFPFETIGFTALRRMIAPLLAYMATLVLCLGVSSPCSMSQSPRVCPGDPSFLRMRSEFFHFLV